MSNTTTLFDLLHYNNQRIAQFKTTRIMQLLEQGVLNLEGKKEKFLAALLIWSHYFQRTLYARQAFCFEEPFETIFREHLAEEFGHDLLLQQEHNDDSIIEDAHIDAAGTWFLNSMLSSSNLEKLIIVNLVLESAGDVFYTTVFPFFQANMKKKGGFFQIHAQADAHHSQIGMDLIKDQSAVTYSRLISVAGQSWDMLEIIFARIADHLQA